ncbi:putative Sensor histidine kinase MalK [Streptomyces afghaniensis 772]|uniref:Putative Sensor histidine kinase MalK n=1 Tax=Streptomyces afghaniensis 772 TaxID=1283301 RepID=S4MF64_9ACTN|nr:putative Sensor histidine kinase MalK [Streptomyces afghaniensis 772]
MFSQVLLMQVAIAAGVAVLATGLFLAPLSDQLDDQAMRRALAIAQTTAQQPGLAREVRDTPPSPNGPVQQEAERIRKATKAEYIVVMDWRGVRWSHTDPKQIGGIVSTDPGQALAGKEVMEIDSGTLGRSARGKVPLRDSDGTIVGAVSVGIAYDSVRARLIHAIPGLLAYAGGALAVGALAAWLISGGSTGRPGTWPSRTSRRSCRNVRRCCTASGRASSPWTAPVASVSSTTRRSACWASGTRWWAAPPTRRSARAVRPTCWPGA